MAEDYEHFQKALGKRLQKLRKERGFSLRDMTVLHGYAESQWRRMEREGVGTTQSLLRIARAFQTTVGDLLDGLGQYPKMSVKGKAQRSSASPSDHKEQVSAAPQIPTWAESSARLMADDQPQEEPSSNTPDMRKPKFAVES
ncbi:MAG: helix-turn-helix domain-containing protein [Janthinobacterium lividum]